MMHICMIFDPDACTPDAGFFRVGRTDERTNEQADSRSWIDTEIQVPIIKYRDHLVWGLAS